MADDPPFQGHSHVTIQRFEDANEPLNPEVVTFFAEFNDPAANGELTAVVEKKQVNPCGSSGSTSSGMGLPAAARQNHSRHTPNREEARSCTGQFEKLLSETRGGDAWAAPPHFPVHPTTLNGKRPVPKAQAPAPPPISTVSRARWPRDCLGRP
jgi:hypothetical protein